MYLISFLLISVRHFLKETVKDTQKEMPLKRRIICKEIFDLAIVRNNANKIKSLTRMSKVYGVKYLIYTMSLDYLTSLTFLRLFIRKDAICVYTSCVLIY